MFFAILEQTAPFFALPIVVILDVQWTFGDLKLSYHSHKLMEGLIDVYLYFCAALNVRDFKLSTQFLGFFKWNLKINSIHLNIFFNFIATNLKMFVCSQENVIKKQILYHFYINTYNSLCFQIRFVANHQHGKLVLFNKSTCININIAIS